MEFDRSSSGIEGDIAADQIDSQTNPSCEIPALSSKFRNALEDSVLGIVVDRGLNDKLVFANASLAKLLGYDNVAELLAVERVFDLIDPRYHEQLQQHDEARLRGENAPSFYEAQFARKDGSLLWCQGAINLVNWDGERVFYTTIIDISARKSAEDSLRESELKFRNLIEGSIQGVWIDRGLDEPVVFANQAIAEMLGYEKTDDLLALKASDVFAPHEYQRIKKHDEARLAGDFENAPARYEAQYIRRDGSLIWTENIVNIITWDGAPAFQSTVVDITSQKKAEDQLRQSHKMEAIGQLTAGVAHDFNNLLAVIMSHAEILRVQFGDDEHSVNSLIKAASRGSELTKKLLAFSRKQALRPQATDVYSLIIGMSDMLARTLGENAEIEFPPPCTYWPVFADPGQLENAILNLAINARDAMPSGGRISFSLENVRLDDKDREDGVELNPGEFTMIEVSDNGDGMPPEVLNRAFDPFYTTKGVGVGSGLGLSMVYGFVRQSGGDVKISSATGHGTKVRLYLPRSGQAVVPIREERERSIPKARGETILVLEDDSFVRDGISKLLSQLGYFVHQAGNGDSALAKLEPDQDIDLMLSDVMLRGEMNGPEVVSHALRMRANLKVIFMTGYTDLILRERPTLGDVVTISKPVRLENLANTIRKVLDDGIRPEVLGQRENISNVERALISSAS